MNKKDLKKFYGKDYKPNKMAKPVVYKGTEYLSKAQCMALEGITRKELDAYLKGKIQADKEPQLDMIENVILEEEDLGHNPLDDLYGI